VGDRHPRLPLVVRAVAHRVRRAAAEDAGTARAAASLGRESAPTLVTGSSCGVRSWAMAPGSRVAVLIEAARPPELAPLIADAYALTRRERLVTELVARGLSTHEIAGRLHICAYTVQDHLKAIFDKTGCGSRGDLVAQLFFRHYAPRLTAMAEGSAAEADRKRRRAAAVGCNQ
jgi:DNA-binding NarL/FixJ family response regulator